MVVIVRVKFSAGKFSALGRGLPVLAAAAASLLLYATPTTEAPLAIVRLAPAAYLDSDPRASRLEMFFRKYHCPAPHHISEYLRAADLNALDYRLLPAISIRETQCGVHEQDHNRLGYHPGEGGFPSVEAGIHFIARRLAEHPFYKGKTLHGKLFVYNPRPAYPGEIQQIMREIE